MAKKASSSKSRATASRKSGSAKTNTKRKAPASKAKSTSKKGTASRKKVTKKAAKKRSGASSAKTTTKSAKAAKAGKATKKAKATKAKAAKAKSEPKKMKANATKVPAGRKKKSGGKKGKSSKAAQLLNVDHTSEDIFASQLLEELDFRHGIDVATLDVRIRDGVAVARGSVSDLEELEAVRDTVQDAGGITDLTFVVQVAPDRRETDRDRARQIQETLDGETDLADENILVACVGRKVVVRGTVRTRMRKLKAGLVALRCGDAARVANRLVVLSEM